MQRARVAWQSRAKSCKLGSRDNTMERQLRQTIASILSLFFVGRTGKAASRNRGPLSSTPSVVVLPAGTDNLQRTANVCAGTRRRGVACCQPHVGGRGLLLLPRRSSFSLGLFCSFLRCGFRLRLSLLHHTALLAMRDGELRNSAVANRHALHSDYYRTTKKTATPLRVR